MTTHRLVSALNAESTAEVHVVLAAITHPDLAALGVQRPDIGIEDGALRLCANDAAIVSRGKAYLPYAFSFVEPEQGERAAPEARIRIDNVDRRIVEILRSLPSSPVMQIELVLAHEPDVVEQSFPAFIMPAPSWSATTVEAGLTVRNDDDEPACAWTHNPAESPGLH
jgi:hypothetical protein